MYCMDGLQGKMAAGVAWKGNCVGRAALNAPPLIRIAAANAKLHGRPAGAPLLLLAAPPPPSPTSRQVQLGGLGDGRGGQGQKAHATGSRFL
jgi:hypothetical protein